VRESPLSRGSNTVPTMRAAVAVIEFMRALLRISLVALVALTAGVSVAGCGYEEEDPTKDPNLVALKQERMATFTPGGRLVLDIEVTDHISSFFSEHLDARVTHVFAFRDPERARRGRVAAVAAAQASGWKLNLEGADESPIFGRKRLTTGAITLIIGWYKDEDEGVHKVSIRLEHHPCGRGRCY